MTPTIAAIRHKDRRRKRRFSPRVTSKSRSGLVRSMVKTVTYRIVSASSTMALAWAVFGSPEAAGAFGMIDLGLNTALYFGHERLWAWIDLRPKKRK